MAQDLKQIQQMIDNIEDSLARLRVRRTDYVEETSIPLDLIKDIQTKEKNIAELKQRRQDILEQQRMDLINILRRDPRYQREIDQTWRKCYQMFKPKDYTASAPTTLEEALNAFDDLPVSGSKYPIVLQFVDLLTRSIIGTLGAQLTRWLSLQVDSIEQLKEWTNDSLGVFQARQDSTDSPQLLIWIQRKEDGDGYTVRRILLIKNSEIYDPKIGTGAVPLDGFDISFEDSGIEDQDFNLAQVKHVLRQRIDYTASEYEIDHSDLIVNVFLSFSYLDWDVDRWPATEDSDPELIGYRCKGVVLRIVDRFLAPQYQGERQFWRNKWEELQTLMDRLSHQHIFPGDGLSGKRLVAQLRQPNRIGVRLTQAPPHFTADTDAHPFHDFVRSGVPIALWPRQELGQGICGAEYERLLNCSLCDLLETLRQRRQQTDLEEDNHICHHLSLFWEDPNLVPPELYKHKPRIRMPTP